MLHMVYSVRNCIHYLAITKFSLSTGPQYIDAFECPLSVWLLSLYVDSCLDVLNALGCPAMNISKRCMNSYFVTVSSRSNGFTRMSKAWILTPAFIVATDWNYNIILWHIGVSSPSPQSITCTFPWTIKETSMSNLSYAFRSGKQVEDFWFEWSHL